MYTPGESNSNNMEKESADTMECPAKEEEIRNNINIDAKNEEVKGLSLVIYDAQEEQQKELRNMK